MNDTNCLPVISILESQRLKLRPITLDDAQALFNYAKNVKMTKYVPWKAHKSINDSIDFINTLLKEYEQLCSLMWTVQLKDDKTNTMIGTCGFIRYFAHTKCLEIGYAFNPKVWGKGYAKEALLTAIKYGFENTDTIRIEGNRRLSAIYILNNKDKYLPILKKHTSLDKGYGKKYLNLLKDMKRKILKLSI